MSQIWYRKSKKAWYVQVNRKCQKRLGATKKEAEFAYRQWLIEHGATLAPTDQKKLTVEELGQEFLDLAQTKKRKTYEFYRYFLVPFVKRFGAVVAKDLSPVAFEKWLESQRNWKGSRRNAIVAVRRLYNWAIGVRLLSDNPILVVKKPAQRRRMRFLSTAERDLILASIPDQPFREYCFALFETGCRPMEVAKVAKANVSSDGSTWILDEHKTDHTGHPRVVYLTPAMQELTRRLVQEHSTGPLFRGTRVRDGIRIPWTANAIRCRFRGLRKRHPELAGVTAYTLRHHFATQALLNGVPGPLVSSLLGHRSLKMLDIYSHVGQAATDLHQAAIRATARA